MCERELETEQNCNILTPTLMAISVVFLVLLVLSRRPGGSAFCWVLVFSTTSCLRLLRLQLTDFLLSLSYIIVQSPTQSLEWNIWSSSSGNNSHAVHSSLSSGASVYECTMGFYLVPYRQPSPPTRFLLITAIGMCHFLPVHHFGMACLAGSKVNRQIMFYLSPWSNFSCLFVSYSCSSIPPCECFDSSFNRSLSGSKSPSLCEVF